ncbi:phosphoribosylglycinamide formyltransferase [Thermaerobacter marianensis DSM 12885]|uniref:Phosphoribosylglycinamide formyltransferase n=1 Tax=Thermaerobacter marianensis (strain ATCC 700841 / DSM 12885 / JCM 10246 / 7p75a) TaxID=644966 RepID=E6SMP0_THEM7|nr:phosphoribosylglycinamide formyltransferase [Thermaerobacter marianensis]ADU51532.1 phosphoribosylglycinamide formyltransferase [Thermaerobacter marianensis DSM 12885]
MPPCGCRIVVLASGAGTNLQALLDAERRGRLGGRIVAVLSDRPGAGALDRARAAGKPAVLLRPDPGGPGPGRAGSSGAGGRWGTDREGEAVTGAGSGSAAGCGTGGTPPAPTPGREAWDRAILAELGRWRPDLVVLAGFMRILGPAVVAAYRNRILNVHPSLLPAFPGKDAPRQALEHGVRITGCTVHFVDEGVDTGPILLQAPVPVLAGDDAETLHRRIQAVEHRLYPAAVRLVATGRVRVEGRRVKILGPHPRTASRRPGRAGPARG